VLRLKLFLNFFLMVTASTCCFADDWPLWKSYTARFMDNQVRVIDHDAGDRTTSEAQAYAMFFALVANDRSRFDGLLHWTEQNLASGDLSAHLPAWLWGRKTGDGWGVLDTNPAADADVWMAYTLLEAGEAWHESRYTRLGTAMAKRIATEEVVQIPDVGVVLLPAPKGFQHRDSYRLNPSYVPLQLFIRLGHALPDGPWQQIAASVPILVKDSAPHGFAMDWTEFKQGDTVTPSSIGSYEAIRVYLWAGMLDSATPEREDLLKALPGMAKCLRSTAVPPAKVRQDGSIEDPNGPVGFSAALLPYLAALGETALRDQQMDRVRSQFDSKTGLYGNPAKYYDQNLLLFALGLTERRFRFDSQGRLKTSWKHD
jgi:endoglucanase